MTRPKGAGGPVCHGVVGKSVRSTFAADGDGVDRAAVDRGWQPTTGLEMSGASKGPPDGVAPADTVPDAEAGDVTPAGRPSTPRSPTSTPRSPASRILVDWVFAPGSDAPGTARRLVSEALGDTSDAIDLIVLMVSELVTNAVLHTQQEAEFRLIDLGPEGLRAEVEDRDGHPPEPSESPGAGGGYGLRIIDGFARSWGTSLPASQPERAGKIVWFEVDWH